MKHIITLLAVLSTSLVWAGNPAQGEKKAQACFACHGVQGVKPTQPDVPVLAGQVEDYLVKALNDYKSGARKNAVMGGKFGQAAALSKQDIEDVAAYFTAQSSSLHVKK